MDRKLEVRFTERAVELGRSGDAGSLPELVGMLKMPSQHVRRLAASAIGKLAGMADASAAVPALSSILKDPHPQVRQYAIKALSAYGVDARTVINDLRDITLNQTEKDYNRKDAEKAISLISEAQRIKEVQALYKCYRCGFIVTSDEYARSMKSFQRIYCDKCFDEVYMARRNFDTNVELNKTIETRKGGFVQSDGEKIIADFLNEKGFETGTTSGSE